MGLGLELKDCLAGLSGMGLLSKISEGRGVTGGLGVPSELEDVAELGELAPVLCGLASSTVSM